MDSQQFKDLMQKVELDAQLEALEDRIAHMNIDSTVNTELTVEMTSATQMTIVTQSNEVTIQTQMGIEEETKQSVSAASKKKKKKATKASTVSTDGPASNLRSRIKDFQNSKQIQMVKPKVGVVFDEEMLLHKNHREHHPERPERAMAIYLNLINKGIYKELRPLEVEPAEDKYLELVHPHSHIQKIKNIIKIYITRGNKFKLQQRQKYIIQKATDN